MKCRVLIEKIFFLTCCLTLLGCAQETSSGFVTNVLRSDVYTQLYGDQRADFLWVMDKSGTMLDKRNYVRDNFQTFINIMNTHKAVDFQMSVTTTDVFSFPGTLISSPTGLQVVKSSASSNPVTDMASIINDIPNSGTSDWQQGLEGAYLALLQNGSLVTRSGVSLFIIILTDEEDFSCASNCSGSLPKYNPNWVQAPISRYISYFSQLKRKQGADVSLFPIVGLPSSKCKLPSLGLRYLSVQEQLGNLGTSGSICSDDIAQAFNNIASKISDRGVKFPLTGPATGEKIEVLVNHKPVPFSQSNGYYFDKSSNSIMFAGTYIPKNGALIEVNYVVR